MKALYTFSGDPITYGHIDIIKRAAEMYDELIVGIGTNPAKNYTFTLEERLDMTKKVLANIPRVKVVHYEGLTADGKYMVAVLLPVSLPLQSTADNPSADGIIFPSNPTDSAAMISYYQSITDKLNAANPDSFQPSLTQLDALIQSITVNSQ